jgi:hypothetical protein
MQRIDNYGCKSPLERSKALVGEKAKQKPNLNQSLWCYNLHVITDVQLYVHHVALLYANPNDLMPWVKTGYTTVI